MGKGQSTSSVALQSNVLFIGSHSSKIKEELSITNFRPFNTREAHEGS
jgi:hypothetical protein